MKHKPQKFEKSVLQSGSEPECTCCAEPYKLKRLSTKLTFYRCPQTKRTYYVTKAENGDLHIIPITAEQARLLGAH